MALYKITFHMDGKGIIYNRDEPIHLDGILACRKFHYMPERNKDNLSRDDMPDEAELPLESIIVNGQRIWKASALFPEGPVYHESRFYRKRFPGDKADGLTTGNIDITKGAYRSYNNENIMLLCHKLVAWYDGSVRRVKKLLRGVNRLGKDRVQGHGQILEITHEETTDNFCLYRDGKTMRFIPHPDGFLMVRPRPPYWNNNGKIPTLPIGWTVGEVE